MDIWEYREEFQNNYQNIYKSKWERQICHTMNHELVYLNPYGVNNNM